MFTKTYLEVLVRNMTFRLLGGGIQNQEQQKQFILVKGNISCLWATIRP